MRLLVGSGDGTPMAAIRTDERGRFRADRIPPGAYALVGSAPGHATRRVTLWVLGGHNRSGTLELARSALLSGVVVDGKGKPVPGARVEARERLDDVGVPASARSDSAGRFTLHGLASGVHRLRVSADGYMEAARERVRAPARGLRVRLVRMYRVRGAVLGPLQQHARVLIAGSGIWPGRQRKVRPDGTFEIDQVPAGVYELVATAQEPGDASGREPRVTASGVVAGLPVGPFAPPPVLLGLRPAQRLVGLVRAGDAPVPGATISLGRGMLSVMRHRVVTDGSGRFALGPLAPGDYQFGVWARGYLPLISHTVQVPASLPLQIELSRGSSLSGGVVDEQGAAVAGARIRVVYRSARRSPAAGGVGELGVIPGPVPPIPPPGQSGSTPLPLVSGGGNSSDGSGEYHLWGLQPGEVQLVLTHHDYAEARSGWVKLGNDEVRQLPAVVMRRGARLSGRILDERGVGIEAARVTVSRARGEWSRTTFADAQGRYLFEGLVGRVVLAAARRGYLPGGLDLRLAGGHDREVDLPLEPARGLVSGFVLDPLRLPVEGARVVAVHGRHRVKSRTDRSGFFQLVGVGTRSLELRVEHEEYVPVRQQVNSGTETEIRLRYLASVAGRVEDARGGAPVEQYALEAMADRFRRRTRVSDGRGAFELRGIPAGPVELRVEAQGYASQSRRVTVKPASRPLELTLEGIVFALARSGTVTGRVTDLLGRPVAGAVVQAAGLRVRTAADGSFTLAGVPEGSRRVVVTHAGKRLQSDPVVVRGDETSGPLRLELN